MKKITAVLAIGICLAVFVTAGPARATDILQATEFQVTFDGQGHSTPMIGHDAIGDLIVFSQYPVVNGVAGNASIYYQRVANGAPTGPEVVVADSPENQWLNDVSGDYIVYTLSPSIGQLGNIVLYQISTGAVRILTSAGNAWNPRIFGDAVVWIEVQPTGASQVVAYWISTGVPVQSFVMAGSAPSADRAAVGDRFIVWEQLVNNQYDLAAYDIQKGISLYVAHDPQVNEMIPSTEGAWVAYQTSAVTAPNGTSIEAVNLDTGEQRIVADGSGIVNARPSISGNLISYESYTNGNWQIFVYRIAQGDTFQVTHTTYNDHLNNIKGNLVTYIDNRNGNDNVFASYLTFTTPYSPPIANAGPSQTVHEGSTVTLDGSGSSDPSGNAPLTYKWSFVSVPAGSFAILSNPTALHPTFIADLTGNYVIQLVVANSLGTTSNPVTVTISTYNTPPVADPGPDQSITQIGVKVQLDGSHSYDADGDPLTFAWTFVTIPEGSKAILTGPTTTAPTFVADVHGTYIVQLVVSDPWAASAAKMMTVSFTNVKPVADAGAGQVAEVGDVVTLNGSGSSDANGDPLTYQWSFVSIPLSSQAAITNPTAVQTAYVPDMPGIYIAQLIVNDGFFNSDPSTVQIKVVSALDNAKALLKDLVNTVGSLDKNVFKNREMRKELINKLHDVMSDLEQRRHNDSLQDLQRDIMRRVDGCVRTGAPDRDDWIIDCQVQEFVHDKLMNVIAEVKELMKE